DNDDVFLCVSVVRLQKIMNHEGQEGKRLQKDLTISSCTSFNAGYPDPDKNIIINPFLTKQIFD
ncbi:hypothetical protein, partial [Cuspidothrix issatschenkoi]|uniref:hypothetical protein n=1 Tax=Cuspidothrix issatschenkoi TaxID=230752 RepID=UPI001D13DB48